MDKSTTVTCVRCPRGCLVTVDLGADSTPTGTVHGNACKRGESYALAEVTNPVRGVATTVPVDGSSFTKTVPVKTACEVSKERVMDVARALATVRVTAPIEVGDVVLSNVAHTGVDVIATSRA